MVRELSSPGVEDTWKARQIGAEEALGLGEACEGARRGMAHGLVGAALRRTEEGAERLRDGTGEKDVWPGELFVAVVVEPLLGCVLLALGAVAVAACVMDAVWFATTLALRETMAVMAAVARLDGMDDLAV